MAPPVLSYARPIRSASLPLPNPVATVALWVGGIGWASAGLEFVVVRSLFGDRPSGYFGVVILGPSSVPLALTAVAIGPNRRRAAIVLAALFLPYAAIIVVEQFFM